MGHGVPVIPVHAHQVSWHQMTLICLSLLDKHKFECSEVINQIYHDVTSLESLDTVLDQIAYTNLKYLSSYSCLG